MAPPGSVYGPLLQSAPVYATASFSRRFRFLRLLEGSLMAGAAYDLGFALLMVAAPGVPAGLLGLPLPGERFYLWILAVVLAMLAALYVAAARDPRRYSAIIVVAIGGRILGGLVLALAAAGQGLPGLWPLAALDLAFGLAHLAFWAPIRS
jgi:lysylphosphatidylglycerol synthetase-like protein (DUF2156 family)